LHLRAAAPAVGAPRRSGAGRSVPIMVQYVLSRTVRERHRS
jgi:hypothetical protein